MAAVSSGFFQCASFLAVRGVVTWCGAWAPPPGVSCATNQPGHTLLVPTGASSLALYDIGVVVVLGRWRFDLIFCCYRGGCYRRSFFRSSVAGTSHITKYPTHERFKLQPCSCVCPCVCPCVPSLLITSCAVYLCRYLGCACYRSDAYQARGLWLSSQVQVRPRRWLHVATACWL